MTSRGPVRLLTTALFSLFALGAAADDPDQPIAPGRQGELSIQLHLHGTGPRGPVDRRMEIALPLVSQETAFIHLLQSGADDDQSAFNDDMEGLNAEVGSDGEAFIMEWAVAMERVIAVCGEQGEESAACKAVGAELDRYDRRNEELKARIEDGQARAAANISAHRYQPWSARGADLCGTLSAVIADPGGASARLDLSTAGADTSAGTNCFHQIVLDRKTGRVTLAVADLDIELPVPGAARGMPWIARDALPIRPDGTRTGALVLEDVEVEGDLRRHQGDTSLPLEGGLVLDVTWRFRAF